MRESMIADAAVIRAALVGLVLKNSEVFMGIFVCGDCEQM
jgi:hypothetical protein